ncbi:MAG TPA: hypothetical protein VLU23_01840 [Pseudolabrys sp.]|jgi:hypothetical protein|nr:hypothetical protein [Pseudolabrys sp.]
MKIQLVSEMGYTGTNDDVRPLNRLGVVRDSAAYYASADQMSVEYCAQEAVFDSAVARRKKIERLRTSHRRD